MKTRWTKNGRGDETGGAMVGYLAIVLLTMATLAAVSSYTIQSLNLANRRQHMVDAWQFAQGGVNIGCADVEYAQTNPPNAFLQTLTASYIKNESKSTDQEVVYEKQITSPFTNQTVLLQLIMTNSPTPRKIKVKATTQVGEVAQTVEAGLEVGFGQGGAIISTHPGTTDTGADKGTAQKGNISIAGGGSTTKVVGGATANGNVNVSTGGEVDLVSMQNYGTTDEIPDFTDPGSPEQLFDFNRFTAAADRMGTHYTNLASFLVAAKGGTNIEGIIVVDIQKGESSIKPDDVHADGIKIIGTLVFKFTSAWSPSDKLVNTADLSINAGDLSGLDPADPSTYATGYPPVFTDPKKDPTKVNLTPDGYDNFKPGDDLPAFMYNNAIFDLHGNANICGVVYSPVFMEIENKQDGQIQYFKGSIIGGGGIYFENGKNAISMAVFDAAVLDMLSTFDGRGQAAQVVYQR